MSTFFSAALKWLDRHGMFAAALCLIIFIPLYPKLPLLDAIPGYLVRVRIEDVLIGLTGLFWFIQVLRGKITWFTSYTAVMVGYAVVGLVSLLFAVLISQTIPLQALHIGKSALHYLRYLEYFSLFIFMYSGISDLKQAKKVVIGLAIVVGLVLVYGIGQKYAQWPVFSTMNREYSKGQLLQLTADGRLNSTFGGHYDLAAFLVIVLPILFAFLLSTKNWIIKGGLALLQLGGIWLLIEAASEISLVAYPVAIGIVLFLYLKQKLGLLKTTVLSGFLLTSALVVLIGVLALFKPNILHKITNIFSPQKDSQPQDIVTPGQETWSPNAQKYGLSIGIRLDTLWPEAINGWVSNPWLGKGYATLNKQGVDEFTEADSTDNNYLRVLGETGLLGFISLGVLIYIMLRSVSLGDNESGFATQLALGFVAATFGLLVNAILIDVFTASKVAFTYWAIAGLVIKVQMLTRPKEQQIQDEQRLNQFVAFFKRHGLFLVSLAVFILLIHKQPFSNQSLVKNVELSPSSLQSLVITHCWESTHRWQNCIYQTPSTIFQDSYAVYLFPWLALFKEPSIFYFANLILALLGITLIYKALQRIGLPDWLQFLLLIVLATQPLIYQLPSEPTPANFVLPIIGLVLWGVSFTFKIKNLNSKLRVKKWWLLPVGYTVVALLLPSTISTILHNYRDNYRPWRYQAVWRANIFFQPSTTRQSKPNLITAINLDYFKLYGEDSYRVMPMFARIFPPVTLEPETYVTNADINRNQLTSDRFEQLKQTYGIHLKEIDCDQQCNYYRLYPENIPLETQPHSLNAQRLQLADNRPLKVMILSQRFEQKIKEVPVSTTVASQELKKITDQDKPDLLFLLGDTEHQQEKVYEQQFRDLFATDAAFPISYIPGNFDQMATKTVPSDSQFFVANHTAFISYQPANDGEVGPQTKLFIFDALLQLEKHPEITNVILITHRSSWLWDRPEYQKLNPDFITSTLTEKDAFFNKELLPAMQKFQNIHWYVVSGDLQLLGRPMVVNQTENNLTYLITSREFTASDTYLELTIDSSGKVTVVAKNLSNDNLPLEQFTLDHWEHFLETENHPD